MNILIALALFLMVYWKIRNQYYERLTIAYSYKLYDLRNKIRDLAVKNTLDAKDWRFKYLDSSVSKTINELSNLNLFTSLILFYRYSKNTNFKNHTKALAKAMNDDSQYKLLYENYSIIIFVYIFEKHFWLKAFFNVLRGLHLLFENKKVDKLKKGIKQIINFIRIAPETSTAFNYCN